MLTKLIVVIILQCIHISNHYGVTKNEYNIVCQLYHNKTEKIFLKE